MRTRYEQDTQHRIAAFVAAARNKGCDLMLLSVQGHESLERSSETSVTLRSTSWGYDICLVKEARHGRFFTTADRFIIEMSRNHEGCYRPVLETSSLSAALKALEKMYWDAAYEHRA